jgi:hypothetical protein
LSYRCSALLFIPHAASITHTRPIASASRKFRIEMAYVLSLRPHSPLKRSFSDNPYLRSCSSHKDLLLNPLSDITGRNASTCSLYTLESNRAVDWSRGSENISPLASQSRLELLPEGNNFDTNQPRINLGPRKRSYGLSRAPLCLVQVIAPSSPTPSATVASQVSKPSISNDDSVITFETADSRFEESGLFDLYEAIHSPLPDDSSSKSASNEAPEPDAHTTVSAAIHSKSQPFRRWISVLRRRHIQRRREYVLDDMQTPFDAANANSTLHSLRPQQQSHTRRTSDSMSSSMGCVTVVKSASITIASTSIAPRSDAGAYGKTRLGNRSSNHSEARRSIESHRGALGPIIDEGAWLRSLQRRKIVEELVASEESYIADLKVLINVSCTPARWFMLINANS